MEVAGDAGALGRDALLGEQALFAFGSLGSFRQVGDVLSPTSQVVSDDERR